MAGAEVTHLRDSPANYQSNMIITLRLVFQLCPSLGKDLATVILALVVTPRFDYHVTPFPRSYTGSL